MLRSKRQLALNCLWNEAPPSSTPPVDRASDAAHDPLEHREVAVRFRHFAPHEDFELLCTEHSRLSELWHSRVFVEQLERVVIGHPEQSREERAVPRGRLY